MKQIWMEMDELVYQSLKTYYARQALGLETTMIMMYIHSINVAEYKRLMRPASSPKITTLLVTGNSIIS
jgi:hypothetical protein